MKVLSTLDVDVCSVFCVEFELFFETLKESVQADAKIIAAIVVIQVQTAVIIF